MTQTETIVWHEYKGDPAVLENSLITARFDRDNSNTGVGFWKKGDWGKQFAGRYKGSAEIIAFADPPKGWVAK